LIIELMCWKKAEANPPAVRFRKTYGNKNEEGVLWVWKGEESVLHAENLHGSRASVVEQEYTSQILAAT